MSLTVTNPSYDKVYPMYAWRDNNRHLTLVQGEGANDIGVVFSEDGMVDVDATAKTEVTANHIKAPRFQLRDGRGVIDLTDCEVTFALKRPDGSEDLLACNIENAAEGIISFPITASSTAIAGEAIGEIWVSSENGTIKFYGVHATIYKGISEEAAVLATQFSALISALQKVAIITPEGSVALDEAITEGGTNPVASGVIYDFLNNYILKSDGMHFIDATASTSGISSVDDCIEVNTIYKANFASGIVATSSSYVMCVRSENKYIQYAFTREGIILFRSKSATAGSTWSDWDYIMHDTIENAIVRGFKDVRITQSFNVENALVQTYMDNPDYTDDYSTSYVPAQSNIPNSEHGRPNTVSVVAPYSSASICIRDTVTQDEWTEPVLGSPYLIDNLIPNHIYAYTFHRNDGTVVSSGTCKATGQVRMINGGGNTFNIRDLGGWSCDGGTIKYGKIYRGCELNGSYFNISLDNDQIDFFKNQLLIRDEIDLRTDTDREKDNITSSALGLGVTYYPIEYKYYQNALLSTNTYQTVNIIKRLAKNLKEDRPSYIHCQAGADRTATLCVMLEAICGVSQSDIDRDYELTSFSWSYYKNGAQTPEWQGRLRSNGTLGYANYKTLIRDIKALEGDTFQDKIVRFLLRSGVSIDEINDIRFYLIDGNPEALVSPYGSVTVTKNLSNIRLSNAVEKVEKYQPFVSEVIVDNMCEITSLQITMNGVASSQYYSHGVICIPNVTGNIVITGTAIKTSGGGGGYSPTASVTKSGKTTTITITDMSGTTTATVSDGQDGEDWIPTAAEKSAIATEAAGLIDISGKADKSDTYTKAEVDNKVATVYRYKGSVSSIQSLPDTGLTVGDVYNVESDGNNFAWTGTEWDKLGGTVDLSGYQPKIDDSQKLSSDFIDDTNKTNKFVTDTEKAEWNAKYNKPSAGIPKTDLASAVQTSLNKADTALQSYTEQYTGTISGIIMNGENKGTSGTVDLGTVITAHQDISGKADKASTYTKTEVDTKLSNKANSADVYTKTQSDGKYLTEHQDISGKADKASTLAGYGISDGETTLHKVTSITADANDTQYPSALAVKKAIDATNPYVFVTEIPEDADHNKKYVLPDGYIWKWQEGTSSIPYNANTKIIVTIQNDKKLYTCTKEILKYRIAGMQMKEIQIGQTLCSPETLKTPLKNQVRQNAQSSVGRGIAKFR